MTPLEEANMAARRNLLPFLATTGLPPARVEAIRSHWVKVYVVLLLGCLTACGGDWTEPEVDPLWCPGANSLQCVETNSGQLMRCWTCKCVIGLAATSGCFQLEAPDDMSGQPCGEHTWRGRDGQVSMTRNPPCLE